MSLDQLDPSDDPDNGSSSSSSSRSSRSSKQEEQRVPYMVIWKDDNENYHAVDRPQDEKLQITYARDSRDDDWEMHSVPSCIERYWMHEDSFRRVAHVVEEVADENLRSIIKDDPEQTLEIIKESNKHYGSSESYSTTEKCPVCRKELHVVYGEFERLNDRRVCPDHTVKEIKDAGLTHQGGVPRNRVWE